YPPPCRGPRAVLMSVAEPLACSREPGDSGLRITHHLDATTILALASGTLDEALGVVAASHVWWCNKCREALKEAERLSGFLLNRLTGSGEEAARGAMGETGGAAAAEAPQQALAENIGLPLPVASRLGGLSLSDIRWRWAVPGLSLHELEVATGGKARLFLMR